MEQVQILLKAIWPVSRRVTQGGCPPPVVDHTGRLFRDGKALTSAELSGILERLGSSVDSWRPRLEKLRAGRLLGRFFAASRERLREVAARLAAHHLANLAGCPAR